MFVKIRNLICMSTNISRYESFRLLITIYEEIKLEIMDGNQVGGTMEIKEAF